jgi:hypothetical protein
MPLNIPDGVTNDISFGPARLFMKPFATGAGATPDATNDVGYIGEDGVTVEITNELKDIVQGNPKLIEYTFSQTQGVMVTLSSIEWDFDNIARAIGAGVTTEVSGVSKTYAFGGEPLVTAVALNIEHQMAVTGNTLNLYVWKAVSESGVTLPFGADEHTFEYKFKAQRSGTDWGANPLPSSEQLIKVVRTL